MKLLSGLFVLLFVQTSQAATLYFECALQDDPSNGVRITVDAEAFKNPLVNAVAQITIIKSGRVVKQATNAVIGERLPVMKGPNGWPVWAMSVSLGRSGYVRMGYNPVPPSEGWYLNAQTLEFNTGGRLQKAICRVIDSSGMSR